MSDETSTNGGTDLGTPEAALGPAEAAAIMREQEERAQRAFRISHRGSFVVWGAVTLLGYGSIWLGVHSAQPAKGPNPVGFALVSVLALGSALAAGAEAHSDAGVGGVSARRRRPPARCGWTGHWLDSACGWLRRRSPGPSPGRTGCGEWTR
jgi:hypothetical protein